MSVLNVGSRSTGSFRRAATGVALAAVSATVLSATPAEAGERSFLKTSGRMVGAQWLEVGTLPGGVPGNIHFGQMFIEDLGAGRVKVFGDVLDLTCPQGVIPSPPAHGEPTECIDEGARFIHGGDVTLSMDRKFTTASLTGTLNVFGHDGPSGSPAVNMTFTGFGDLQKSVETIRRTDGTTTMSGRYTLLSRTAQVSGNIGA